jgi:hypothetical protein
MRLRFWFEVALAVGTWFLLALTLAAPDWIEVVFGVDPDAGSGALEWLIVAAMALSSVALTLVARAELRSSHASS